MGSTNSTLVLDLKEACHENECVGKLIIRAEPKNDRARDSISMNFQGREIAGTFLFLPERAYFTISKLVYRGEATGPGGPPIGDSYKMVTNEKGEEWLVVYESELTNGPNPSFREVYISQSKLCSGDMNAPLKFTLYVSRLCDDHKYKGEFQISCQELLEGPASYNFVNKDTRETNGCLQLLASMLVKEYTMVEYLKGGTQIGLGVAIDFTASNGDPHLPGSLHYCDHSGQVMNVYQQAILAVGNILLNYDKDKEVDIPNY